MFAILFDIKMLKSETLALLYQIDIILTSLHVMCFTQYIHKIQLFIFSKGDIGTCGEAGKVGPKGDKGEHGKYCVVLF